MEQPVSLDADPLDFRVAQLSANFTDLTRQSINDDFALAIVLPGISVQSHPLITGVSGRLKPTDFTRGLPVTMLGQISGPAGGSVIGLQASVRVQTFGNVNFPFWQYNNLILYSVRNAKGDSGAAIVESATGLAVGLHVAGDNSSLGLFYPVAPVFQAFNLQLI